MKFYLFECCEYMDMYPTETVNVFDSEEKAREWAVYMTKNYSGGPTCFKKEMSAEEAAEYLAKEFKTALLDRKIPDDMAIEDAMNVTSEKNIKLFIECYGRNK